MNDSIRRICIGWLSVFLMGTGIGMSFAATDAITPQFSYHTFTTCSELESTLRQILPTTYSDTGLYTRGGVMMPEGAPSAVAPTAKGLDTTLRSDTNTQVKGIDEADTVKIDGKYIYTYQESEHAIIILDAKNLNKIKTIRIPTNYSGVTFYITHNKLILTATKSIGTQKYWTYWYDNTQKSVIALYDISNPIRTSLVRNIEVDGYLSDTRLGDTGIMTAVVATSYRMPPIYRPYLLDSKNIRQPIFDYSTRNLIPRISDQQISLGKRVLENRGIADCTGMSSILPKTNTLSNFTINPTLASILRFDVSIPGSKITSQVVLSEAGQIHVTHDSVYLTANMWQQNTTSHCPINARCASPMIWNPGTSSTFVHRFAVSNTNIRYRYSTLIAGSPLSQYSMDEDASTHFRIVTSLSSWSGGTNTSSTKLSVLHPSGTVVGSLSNIAPGENFQSSRFIANRLYLVTFQQIDPLFVIDIADPKTPKILGELKIPGYSTYLHPYDEDRLIGLGYDTTINQWGGTQNAGIKVDLYNVSDIKNPKQESTLTLGDIGSSSDVLWNPKAFVWYKEKNLLLIPATLMKSAGDIANPYLAKGAFQGLVGVSITPNTITEQFRISHIVPPSNLANIWKRECELYFKNNSGYQQYIPDYCKPTATLDMYFVNTLGNYSADFINRVLYVGENLYTIGNSKIQMQTFSSPNMPIASQKFKILNSGHPIPIDIMPMSTMVR